MADQVDRVLQEFFKGDLATSIESRKKFIKARVATGESLSEATDTQLIALKHHFDICKQWTDELPERRYKVLKGIYTKDITWIGASIEYKVSISTIRDWRNLLKTHIKPWLFIKDNEKEI